MKESKTVIWLPITSSIEISETPLRNKYLFPSSDKHQIIQYQTGNKFKEHPEYRTKAEEKFPIIKTFPNVHIVNDPNYNSPSGNIEFIRASDDVITYNNNYQYKNPYPGENTIVYNNKVGDVLQKMIYYLTV